MISYAAALCLSSVIHYEARGETRRGQIAVAQVVVNRVKSSKFPNKVCKVVKQKNQFSWYKKGKKLTDAKIKLAYKVLREQVDNPIGACLYFSSNGVNWGKRLRFTIGRHNFYR